MKAEYGFSLNIFRLLWIKWHYYLRSTLPKGTEFRYIRTLRTCMSLSKRYFISSDLNPNKHNTWTPYVHL